MSIIEEIVEKRRRKVKIKGHEMGVKLPSKRTLPVIPFGRDPFIICEIKRSSPSRGVITGGVDALYQARKYADRGIQTVSVLTEEDYFSGSLGDLFAVKNAFHGLSLLRKDFILDEKDIEVSFRAGADAVLLIASMHDVRTLIRLYRKTKTLGMEVLFEVHNKEDLKKAGMVKPDVTGFNSRDLITFRIDLTVPIKLGCLADWKTRKVFESGISSAEDADLALSSGFSGLLTGEAVMKDVNLIDKLKEAFCHKPGNFWQRLFSIKKGERPYIKICGITGEKDAVLAAEMGADILGFIFADSPRRAAPELLEKIRDLNILKAGVVVLDADRTSLYGRIKKLLNDGFLDAIQFHGSERPEDCHRMAFPYYKALRIKDTGDIENIGLYRCPRVLTDTYMPGISGGTGKRIPDELVSSIKERYHLWLAGGIGPHNAREIIKRFKPELIDVSSQLESSPGIKDHGKIKQLFEEIEIGTAI